MNLLLKDYWPILFIVFWILYSWWKSRNIRKMLPALLQSGAVIVDVRTEREYSSGAAPGSLNIPLNELKARVNELSYKKPIILYCASGTRSAFAAIILKGQGFKKVYNIGSWAQLVK